MLRHVATLAVMALLAVPVSGQILQASVSPSRVAPGDLVTLSLTNPVDVEVLFLDSCLIRRVTFGTPNGPPVWQPTICKDIVLPLTPGMTLTETFDFRTADGGALPFGDYFLHVAALIEGRYTTHAYPVEFAKPGGAEAILALRSDPHVGTTACLTLDAIACAGGLYAVAVSASTDVGIPLGGFHIALDPDALFALSFPIPAPEFFQGFRGEIDDCGCAYGIAMKIPGSPILVGHTIWAQAFALPRTLDGRLCEVSNTVSITFLP